MPFYETLRTAFIATAANKLRAALTILGILVGVAAVIGMVSVGEGASASIANTLQGLGTNLVLDGTYRTDFSQVEADAQQVNLTRFSLFFPETTEAKTIHTLALQTNYVSTETGDCTAKVNFPVAKTIVSWPFLTGVDVAASPRGAAIVAFGSSLTDGDGSTKDTNRRWPDVLAERLQKEGGSAATLGVLNEGIIGNRLLSDFASPRQAGGPPPLGAVFEQLGSALGEAGMTRFERDVLERLGLAVEEGEAVHVELGRGRAGHGSELRPAYVGHRLNHGPVVRHPVFKDIHGWVKRRLWAR